MKNNPDHTTQNPDEPALPGEVERDNDALRPNDPAKRKQEGHPGAGETDAQKTGRHHVSPSSRSPRNGDV